MNARAWWAIAALVVLFFGFCALRGSGTTAVVDTDAARHAMNGAFLYDLVREGKVLDPVRYAESYYGRLPAISMPYHPPLFPAFEAMIFAIGGVGLTSARVAVALCLVASGLLLFGLVWRTHGSPALALACLLAFLAFPRTQALAGEVMLEFPALVWVLCSMLAFARMAESDLRRGAVAFGLFAAAAVWTKQAVFLGLVPIVYMVLARRWDWMRSGRFWKWLPIFVAAALGLVGLAWVIGWSGLSHGWARRDTWQQVVYNAFFYGRVLLRRPELVVVLAGGAVALLLHVLKVRAPRLAANRLYWAWTISVAAVLAVSPAYDERYLFFAYPAVAVIGVAGASRLLFKLPGGRGALVAAAAVFSLAALGQPSYLHGPEEAARLVVQQGCRRVIYFGLTDGNFIFHVRALDPELRTNVIRGEKLPPSLLNEDQVAGFARRHGVTAIVLERAAAPQLWDGMFSKSAVRTIPLLSSQARFRGELRMVRIDGTAESPEPLPRQASTILGR